MGFWVSKKVILITVILLLSISALGFVWLSPIAHAATYTWDGGGATNNWSDCANWSTDMCPVAADTINFNATSTKDSVVDGGFVGSINYMNIASTYTGTISLERSLSVSFNLYQAGGTFDGTNQNLTVGGIFGLSGGTMLAPANFTSNATFTISGTADFQHNNGTVNFAGLASVTLSCNNAVFNLVTFTQGSGSGKTVSSNCTFPLGNNPTITGPITVHGTLSGAGTLTANNNFTLGATGQLSGFTSQTHASTFTIQTGATYISPSTLNVANISIAAGANFTAPSATMTATGNITINDTATYLHNNGTIILTGGSGTLSCGNAVLHFVQITHTGVGTKTISSNCNVPLGNDPAPIGGRMLLNGTLTGTGTFTAVGDFTLGSTGQYSGFTDQTYGSLTMAAGANYTAPTGTLTINGSLNINPDALFSQNGSTIRFAGGGATISCGNTTFELVELAHTGFGTKSISSNCNLPLGHNPPSIIGRVALNGTISGSGTFQASGDFTYNPTGQITGFDNHTFGSVNVTAGTTYAGPLGALTINGTFSGTNATIDLTSTTSLDANNNFTIGAGSQFYAPTTIYFGRGLTIDPTAQFEAGTGTVIFDGGSSATLSCGNAVFNRVEFPSNGSRTVSSNCVLPLGHNPTLGAFITLDGELHGTGTLSLRSSQLTVRNTTGKLVGFTAYTSGLPGYATYSTIIGNNGATIDFTAVDSFHNVALSLANNSSIQFSSGLTRFTGITPSLQAQDTSWYDHNEGTLEFAFRDGWWNSFSGNLTLHDVIIATDPSLPSQAVPSVTFQGDITVNNLTIQPTTSMNIGFTIGRTLTVLNDLVISGPQNVSRLYMYPAFGGTGTHWNINVLGDASVERVRVTTSNNISSEPIVANDSSDSGSNINWDLRSLPYESYSLTAKSVLGPPDFTTYGEWTPATASTVSYPLGNTLDQENNRLYVATCGNRVLVYDLDEEHNPTDNVADYVLGKSNFTDDSWGAFSPTSLNCPQDVYYDNSSQRLFVKDSYRVLIYDLSNGITNGMAANYVIGQNDFTSQIPATNQASFGGGGWSGLDYDPTSQRLFVSDDSNHRVLIFDLSSGISNGMNASYVLGQPDFTSNTSSLSQSRMRYPTDVVFDPTSEFLYVGDSNARILIFDLSSGISNGMNASYVLGQPDFTSDNAELTRQGMSYVTSFAIEPGKRLFAADDGYSRVVVYDISTLSNHKPASVVIGAKNFTTNTLSDDDWTCVPRSQTLCGPETGSMYFDLQHQRLYVSDSNNNRLLTFELPYLHSQSSLTSIPPARVGSTFTWLVPLARVQGLTNYSIIGGMLPPGLELNPTTGTISGIPTSTGSFTFTISFEDVVGDSGSVLGTQVYTLNIGEADPTLPGNAGSLAETGINTLHVIIGAFATLGIGAISLVIQSIKRRSTRMRL